MVQGIGDEMSDKLRRFRGMTEEDEVVLRGAIVRVKASESSGNNVTEYAVSKHSLETLANRIADLEAQLAEAQRREELPTSLIDLVRFMCHVWHKTHEWAMNKAGADAFMSYPMIQGTANQMALSKIGAQSYNADNIRKAVEWMIEQAAIDGGAMEVE